MTLHAGNAAPADTASAPEVKAAFLYNFAKFAEWPADVLPAGAPIVFCIADDRKLAEALDEATAGRDAGGHPLLVRRTDLDGPVRSCHVLYAGGLDDRGAVELVRSLEGSAVLSVSDHGTFANFGGVMHLFVQDGRMRFAVNVDASARQRLRLSSHLLSLALIVKDESDEPSR
jgi:hypothetical protein